MSSKTSGRPQPTANDTRFLRPYVENKELSQPERMQRATYAQALDAHVQKHSQMQKPYQSDDYQHMEYAYPWPVSMYKPNFRDWERPNIPGDTTTEVIPIDDPAWGPGPPGFSLLVSGCDPRCVDDLTKGKPHDVWDPLDVYFDVGHIIRVGFHKNTCGFSPAVGTGISSPIKSVSFVKGSGKIVMLKKWPESAAEIRVIPTLSAADVGTGPFGEEVAKLEIKLEKREGEKTQQVCYASIYATCDCDFDTSEYDTLEWDSTSSVGELAQGGSGAVYFTPNRSCPPYNWSISGAGFTLGTNKTTSNTNTVYADDEACGMADITVTDACGRSCSGSVRSGEGSWVLYYSHQCGSLDGSYCVEGACYNEGGYRYCNGCVGAPPGIEWTGAEAYNCEPYEGNAGWATAASGCTVGDICADGRGCYAVGYDPCWTFRGVLTKSIYRWEC